MSAYGGKADVRRTAQSADAMLEKGCLDGQKIWKRVLAAVKEIQREERRGTVPICEVL
jgi:hypothetical protein